MFLLEGMANGLPCFIAKKNAKPEIIINQVNELVIE